MATVTCPILSVRLFAPARVFKDDLYLNRCATRPVLAATGRLDQVRGLSVALLGLALLSGATVQGQSIVGQVTTVAGVPIPGVSVTGTRLFPLQRLSTATDASGNYILGSALGGNYSVVPSKSGYTFTPASSNVLVTAGGADVTADFTTPATVPRAFTQPAQNLTPTSARLLGSVNPDGAATTAWFEYGLTTSYGSASVPANLSSFAADVPVNIAVTGLLNGTNYHFRIVASNIFGLSLGGDLGFATPSGIPAVTTLGPTEGGAMTMTLNASVNPNGASATGWFEVGTTTNYEFPAVGQNLGNGITSANFSQTLIGLVTGTTYHYRAAASTSFGTNYGADTFFTPLFSDIGAGLPGVSFSAVAWGDYDNDGRLDLLLTGLTSTGRIAQVWRNTGSGFNNINAGLPGVSGQNNGNGSVAWGDYDNDGKLDILLTGWTGSNAIAQVWRNTGSGFALDPSVVLPGVYDGSVAWGDYDNDGQLDILLTGFSPGFGGIAQVWRNTGYGFANINAGLPGVYWSAAGWGDYDNDGRLDILLTGGLSQVWRNTGIGFAYINAALRGVFAGAVAWGDYDNDGRLDILMEGANFAVFPYRNAQVWRNTGSGFADANAGLAQVADGSVAWGDYDNDGWLDILVTGSVNASGQGAVTQIYHNNRDGTFTAIGPGLPGVFRSSAFWGDFDNDGRLDILLTGLDANYHPIAQIWRNNFPRTNSLPSPPSNLNVTASNSAVLLSWNAAADNETPAAGLTYNVRIGTTPGGSDVLSPMSGGNGLRLLPQLGNAQTRSFTRFDNRPPGTTYYWSVQAVDAAFAGSAFSAESSFKFVPVLVPVTATGVTPGDLNGDGIVDQGELNTVLSNYWPYSPWLQMTNPMKLNDGYFQFALTNANAWDFSVLVSTNLVEWDFLGPAFPVYQFVDPAATNAPMRYYRLRWP